MPLLPVLAALQCGAPCFQTGTDETIAAKPNCHPRTLRRRFRDALARGRARQCAEIKTELWRRAIEEHDREALLVPARRLKWDSY